MAVETGRGSDPFIKRAISAKEFFYDPVTKKKTLGWQPDELLPSSHLDWSKATVNEGKRRKLPTVWKCQRTDAPGQQVEKQVIYLESLAGGDSGSPATPGRGVFCIAQLILDLKAQGMLHLGDRVEAVCISGKQNTFLLNISTGTCCYCHKQLGPGHIAQCEGCDQHAHVPCIPASDLWSDPDNDHEAAAANNNGQQHPQEQQPQQQGNGDAGPRQRNTREPLERFGCPTCEKERGYEFPADKPAVGSKRPAAPDSSLLPPAKRGAVAPRPPVANGVAKPAPAAAAGAPAAGAAAGGQVSTAAGATHAGANTVPAMQAATQAAPVPSQPEATPSRPAPGSSAPSSATPGLAAGAAAAPSGAGNTPAASALPNGIPGTSHAQEPTSTPAAVIPALTPPPPATQPRATLASRPDAAAGSAPPTAPPAIGAGGSGGGKDAAKLKAESVANKLRAFKAEVEELRGKVVSLGEEKEAAQRSHQAAVEALEAEVERLKQQLAESADTRGLRQEVAGLRQELSVTKEQASQLQAKLTTTEQTAQSSQAEVQELQRQLEQERAHAQQARDELAALRTSHEDLTHRFNELEEMYNEIQEI